MRLRSPSCAIPIVPSHARSVARTWGAVSTVAAALALFAPTAHAVPLVHGLGGPADFGSGTLAPNDDGSTEQIDLHAVFPTGLRFFAQTFHALYLNNNGNVTFASSLATFTPRAFPVANQPMIAPWWADVDTRPGGMPDRNGVYYFLGDGRFIATWHNVGYYANHVDRLNDFQLVLIDRSDLADGDFDVEFRYDRCEWTTGDVSNGVAAQAGFDAGNQRDFYAIPGSLSQDILHVCDRSNVGVAGLWRFEIRNGEVRSEPDPEGGYDPFFEDAAVCSGRRCHPETLIEGRAGPCFCATPGAPSPRARWGWLALGIAALVWRRRKR